MAKDPPNKRQLVRMRVRRPHYYHKPETSDATATPSERMASLDDVLREREGRRAKPFDMPAKSKRPLTLKRKDAK